MKQRSPLAIIFLVAFLDLLAFGIVIPQLGVYAKLYHASGAQQGWIVATYSLMAFLFAPLLGRWSDRAGRRTVLLFSVACAALGHLLFAQAGSIAGLLVARAVNGFGGANISTAQAYIADVTPPERRAKSMGLIGAAFGIGFILGPAIGGIVGQWGTARWGTAGGNLAIGLTAAGFSALCFLVVLFRLPESLPPEARRPATGPLRLVDLPALRESFSQPILARLLLVFLISTAGFAVLHAVMSFFIIDTLGLAVHDDADVRMAQIATAKVFAWIGLIAAVIQGGAMGSLAKRFGEAKLLKFGLLLMVAGLACLATARSVAGIMGISTLQASGNALATAALPALISFHSPPDRRGEVLGVSQSLSSLGRIFGPLFGGMLYDLGPAVPFVTGAVLCAVAAAVALRVPNQRPAESPAIEVVP